MNDEIEPQPKSSWLDRLSQVLLREPQDREQLVNLLRDAQERQLLDANALGMIEGVLQVSEMKVRDIMIPRAQMVVVEQSTSPQDFIPKIIDSTHSRFPVIGKDRDEVIGILLAKDLLRFCFIDQKSSFDLNDIIRPAVFVPESKRLNILLQDFQMNHNHMAIVVDEYGGVAGVVTIEDVLEQIVGEIEDEFDFDDDSYIKQLSDSQFTIKAVTPLEDFNDFFNVKYNDSEFDTVGGMVLHHFGHLPKRNESITIDKYQFTVLHADNRRIRLLQADTLAS